MANQPRNVDLAESTVRQREAITLAQGGMQAWIALLELIHGELLRGAEAIDPAPGEIDPDVDLDQMDWPTEVRSVLRNVAESSLRPAIEDLRSLLQADAA